MRSSTRRRRRGRQTLCWFVLCMFYSDLQPMIDRLPCNAQAHTAHTHSQLYEILLPTEILDCWWPFYLILINIQNNWMGFDVGEGKWCVYALYLGIYTRILRVHWNRYNAWCDATFCIFNMTWCTSFKFREWADLDTIVYACAVHVLVHVHAIHPILLTQPRCNSILSNCIII